MAVTLNTGLTITTLVEGLWPNLVHSAPQGTMLGMATDLQDAGFKLSVTPSIIRIIADTGKEYAVVSEIALKADSLKLAIDNKIGVAPKKVVQGLIINMIEAAHIKFKAGGGPVPKPMSALGTFKAEILAIYHGKTPSGTSCGDFTFKVAAIKKFREKTGCGLKEAKDQVEAWIDEEAHEPTPGLENPTYKSTKSHVMDLSKAEHLHQAVGGTSPNSRYYVVALGDDAKVAVRIRSATDISIRAICTASVGSKESDEVVAGFETASLQKAQGGHWSIHLHPTDLTQAERSIGATLFAMSIPFWAVTGDLKALVGK